MRDSARSIGQALEIRKIVEDVVAARFRELQKNLDTTIRTTVDANKTTVNIPLGGETAYPVASAAAEGTSPNAARTDHVHALDCQVGDNLSSLWSGTQLTLSWSGSEVFDNGSLIGTYRKLNFLGCTVSDAGDTVNVSVSGTRTVPGSLFGPPNSGTYTTGDTHLDKAGSIWRFYNDGTSEGWKQTSVGTYTDFTTGTVGLGNTALWSGTLLRDGYRVYEPASEVKWVYDTTKARWRSEDTHLITFQHPMVASSGTTDFGGTAVPGTYDYEVTKWAISGRAYGATATDRWFIFLQKHSTTNVPSDIDSILVSGTGYFNRTVLPATGSVTASTHPMLWYRTEISGSGTPGPIDVYGSSVLLRWLR